MTNRLEKKLIAEMEFIIPAATEDYHRGQSHHYETTALSACYSEKIETSNFQRRVLKSLSKFDRLNGPR